MENMKTRRSVRAFVPDRMPARDLVEAVAEAGTYAPTGRGAQSPLIVAVTSKAVRDRLSELNAAVLGVNTDPLCSWCLPTGAAPLTCMTVRS